MFEALTILAGLGLLALVVARLKAGEPAPVGEGEPNDLLRYIEGEYAEYVEQ